MLRWSPREFLASNVWDVTDAWEGYALSKGIKKQNRLDDDAVVELRRDLEMSRKLHKAKYGNA